jgi:hypothetical protein
MKRPSQHVIEDQAEALIRGLVPATWIVRNIPKDYGIDLEIEMVDAEYVTGNRICVQSKGVANLRLHEYVCSLADVALKPEDVPAATDGKVRAEYAVYPLSVKELEYSLRCTVPLLLFVADLRRSDVYWLPLQDEILSLLTKRNPEWRHQKTARVYVPTWNSLRWEAEHDYPGLRWYAAEPARLKAFVSLHYYHHEMQYRGGIIDFVDDFEDEEQAENLYRVLCVASSYIDAALRLRVVFGSSGIDFFTSKMDGLPDPIGVQLRNALTKATAAIEAYRAGTIDGARLFGVLTLVNHAVHLMSTAITMYHTFRQRFLLTAGSLAWRAGAFVHGKPGSSPIPMRSQRPIVGVPRRRKAHR